MARMTGATLSQAFPTQRHYRMTTWSRLSQTGPGFQKLKMKRKRIVRTNSKSIRTDLVTSSEDDEAEGNRRGPNWKEHWIDQLIHLRGTTHEKFSGMKKQVWTIGVCSTLSLLLHAPISIVATMPVVRSGRALRRLQD